MRIIKEKGDRMKINKTLMCFRQKSGVALIWVLMTVFFLAILITGLLTVTLSDAKHAALTEHSKQAVYLAESAAKSAATYLIKNELNSPVQALFSNVSESTIYSDDDISTFGTVTVKVKGDASDPDALHVSSNAIVKNESQNVNLIMKRNLPAPWFGEAGIVAKTLALANGTSYTANTNVMAGDGDGSSDEIEVEPPYTYTYGNELPENFIESFPIIGAWKDKDGVPITTAPTMGPITLNGSDAKVISESEISGGSNKVIVNGNIKLNGLSSLTFFTDTDLYVKIIGDVTTGGTSNMYFTGPGKVYLYIEGSLNLGGTFENQLVGGAKDLIIEMVQVFDADGDPTRTITMGGTPNYEAYIIAPDFNMTVTGDPSFDGLVIVNEFDGGGNFFYQQPDDEDNPPGGTIDWPLQIMAYTK